MKAWFASSLLAFACAAARAHEGHGMTGIHWHASDFAGFGFVAVVAGFVLWLSRGE